MYKQQKKKKPKKKNHVQEERKSKNSGMDSLEVKPHAWHQSNKVLQIKLRVDPPVSSISSKIWLLCSLQITHITQCGTKFQIFEEYFPNQFLHPANKSITFLGKTQATPNEQNSITKKLPHNATVGNQHSPHYISKDSTNYLLESFPMQLSKWRKTLDVGPSHPKYFSMEK